MKKAFFLIFSCGLVLVGCTGTKESVATQTQVEALDKLVLEEAFMLESEWANPLNNYSISSFANSGLLPPGSTAGNINLIGNPNYLIKHGDSIAMFLPYFGEQQVATNYVDGDSTIKYYGVPEEIKIVKKERKQTYQIQFKAKTNRDTYDVFVTLYPNLSSTITVNSAFRTTISYRGRVSKLSDKNKKAIIAK